jgi:ATP-dependent DNA ligase
MLAASGFGVEDVFRRMRGKPFLVELKFDGERMLVRWMRTQLTIIVLMMTGP